MPASAFVDTFIGNHSIAVCFHLNKTNCAQFLGIGWITCIAPPLDRQKCFYFSPLTVGKIVPVHANLAIWNNEWKSISRMLSKSHRLELLHLSEMKPAAIFIQDGIEVAGLFRLIQPIRACGHTAHWKFSHSDLEWPLCGFKYLEFHSFIKVSKRGLLGIAYTILSTSYVIKSSKIFNGFDTPFHSEAFTDKKYTGITSPSNPRILGQKSGDYSPNSTITCPTFIWLQNHSLPCTSWFSLSPPWRIKAEPFGCCNFFTETIGRYFFYHDQ